MDAKEFLKTQTTWKKDSMGMFDRNGLAEILEEYALWKYKKLQHHYDTTIGLWCTDKPELIPEDKKDMFFQLKASKEASETK